MTATADKVQQQIMREIVELARRAELASKLPEIPDPFMTSSWELQPTTSWSPVVRIGISGYQQDSDTWPERVRTLGATLRAFKAHNIERKIGETGKVTYTAEGSLTDGTACELSIMVYSGGINPACRVETEVYEETVKRTRVKVVCD